MSLTVTDLFCGGGGPSTGAVQVPGVEIRRGCGAGGSVNAVDAAAQAWFDRVQAQRLDEGRKRPDGQRWQWSDLTEDDRRAYRALVEPIVHAVQSYRPESEPTP